MTIIKIVKGDLLESGHLYIAHQCNCTTVKSYGLAGIIARKFPWADVYASRKGIGNRNASVNPDTPGTIQIISNDIHHIVCLFAQWTPGKCGSFQRFYPDVYKDTRENREMWFKMCLDEIDKLGLDEIAMPYLIGCGLAGGNWKKYEEMLNGAKTNIVLYRLE